MYHAEIVNCSDTETLKITLSLFRKGEIEAWIEDRGMDGSRVSEISRITVSKVDNTPPSMSVIDDTGDSANYIRLNL